MRKAFEELDFQQTPLGELTLRRREVPELDGLEVFEVKLGDAFLMSSLFHDVEVALADLGLAALSIPPSHAQEPGVRAQAGAWDVVVGGLGLGYTAEAALKHESVASLLVVDALEAVIGWHQRGMVPLGAGLSGDPRCRFIHGDFFELAQSAEGFDPLSQGRLFHAVLLDIDHSPQNLLHPQHGRFYTVEGLRLLAKHLHPGGVFALWSDDAPDEGFLNTLTGVFGEARAEVVRFANPLLECESQSTVYVARL